MEYTGRKKLYKSSGKSGRTVAMFNMSHAAHTILRLKPALQSACNSLCNLMYYLPCPSPAVLPSKTQPVTADDRTPKTSPYSCCNSNDLALMARCGRTDERKTALLPLRQMVMQTFED